MPPVSQAAGVRNYDYVVLGGGSGGLASARRAAEFGVRAVVIENNVIGGTCVSYKWRLHS